MGVLAAVYAQLFFAVPAIGVAFLPVSDSLKQSLWLVLTLLFLWAVAATWRFFPDSSVPDRDDVAESKRRVKLLYREGLQNLKKTFTW